MILLTSQQLAEHLRLGSARTAAKFARETLRLRPYPLGRGRGRGDRWDWREVEEALRQMRAGDSPRPKAQRVKSGHLTTKPVNDLIRELTCPLPTQ
jgi:hypothetical protein